MTGRVPVHAGGIFGPGQAVGEETHKLAETELPVHTHAIVADTTPPAQQQGNVPAPTKRLSGSAPAIWTAFAAPTPMNGQAIRDVGGDQPHENRQPCMALNFCVSLNGVYPSRYN